MLNWLAFYNHCRLHLTLACYLSPMQNEQRWHAAQRTRLHKLRAKNYLIQGQSYEGRTMKACSTGRWIRHKSVRCSVLMALMALYLVVAGTAVAAPERAAF